jgi:hypothetical protein
MHCISTCRRLGYDNGSIGNPLQKIKHPSGSIDMGGTQSRPARDKIGFYDDLPMSHFLLDFIFQWEEDVGDHLTPVRSGPEIDMARRRLKGERRSFMPEKRDTAGKTSRT